MESNRNRHIICLKPCSSSAEAGNASLSASAPSIGTTDDQDKLPFYPIYLL